MALHIVSSEFKVQEDRHGEHCSVPLEDLARHIRDAHKAVQVATANALAAAFEAGESLIEAKKRVVTGWERWVRENCFLGGSTVRLYVQLAHHRAEIEAEISRAGELSIRAAQKLIAKKSPENLSEDLPEPTPTETAAEETEGATPDPVTTVSAGLRALTEEQLTAVWSEFTLHGFLATMPKRWWSELERRITGSRREPALLKESEVLRQALGQIRIAAHATDTRAAEIAENLALTALRALATALVDVDIDRITIVNRYVKEKRCAKRKGRRAT
jgi:hypothetical protein